jgi:predicted small integral membrane protein
MIAALFALAIIIIYNRVEEYKSEKTFVSQIATINSVPDHKFTPADFNQVDTGLKHR